MLGTIVLVALGMASVAAGTVSVAARNYAFTPSSLTVHLGDTVVWAMSGDGHTVTSGTIDASNVGHPSGGPLDSGFRASGQSYSYTFTKAGTYPYFCEVHADSGMKGTIVVLAPVATPKPTLPPTPRSTPRPTPAPSPEASSTAVAGASVADAATPSPTETATVGPTASGIPAPAADPSPGTPSLTAQPAGTTSSGGSDPTLVSAASPLVALAGLALIAIAAAGLWRARRPR